VSAANGGPDTFVAAIEAVGTESVRNAGDRELLKNPIIAGYYDQPASDSAETVGITLENVHERRAQIGVAAQSQNDDGVARRLIDFRQCLIEYRRRREEEAAVRLKYDDLVGRQDSRRV
jgi:hypothetical protein